MEQRGAPAGDERAALDATATAGEGWGHVDPRRPLGRRGEDLALAHYRALGFRPLARNQHRRFGELDLIVFDGHTLVFVEVKTHELASTHTGGRRPRSARDPQRLANRSAAGELGWPAIKQYKRHRRALSAWLNEAGANRPRPRELRLDVVRVFVDEQRRPVRLDHIEGAWEGAW